MSIAQNVQAVREKIAAAALAAGRRPEDILLVAATKTNDAERVREAIAAGVDICGENRVQEMLEKPGQGAYEGAPLHFLGHLQKNKVKSVVGAVELIHSVDSVALMELIHRRAEALGIVQDVLLEVNIGGEASKSGAAPEELPALLDAAALYPHIRGTGLMAIPPIQGAPGKNKHYFCQMRQYYVDIRGKKYDNVIMTELSMGMSTDYEDAVRCGATIVRLGTALFGPRNYNLQEAPGDGTVR